MFGDNFNLFILLDVKEYVGYEVIGSGDIVVSDFFFFVCGICKFDC